MVRAREHYLMDKRTDRQTDGWTGATKYIISPFWSQWYDSQYWKSIDRIHAIIHIHQLINYRHTDNLWLVMTHLLLLSAESTGGRRWTLLSTLSPCFLVDNNIIWLEFWTTFLSLRIIIVFYLQSWPVPEEADDRLHPNEESGETLCADCHGVWHV